MHVRDKVNATPIILAPPDNGPLCCYIANVLMCVCVKSSVTSQLYLSFPKYATSDRTISDVSDHLHI